MISGFHTLPRKVFPPGCATSAYSVISISCEVSCAVLLLPKTQHPHSPKQHAVLVKADWLVGDRKSLRQAYPDLGWGEGSDCLQQPKRHLFLIFCLFFSSFRLLFSSFSLSLSLQISAFRALGCPSPKSFYLMNLFRPHNHPVR